MTSTRGLNNLISRFQPFQAYLLPILELSVLAIIAIVVAYDYITPNTRIVPAGREFLSSIQSHHLWTRFKICGGCAFWNGSIRGGFPAFVDPHGSMLHPLVAIGTLLWGVINGSKFVLIASLWFAGFAQWWMAKVLRVGAIPRIWSSSLVILGGHLSGRMEIGAFGVVLSTAMCSMFFPALLSVFLMKGRIWVFLLAIVSASALISGQGYMQMGIVATLPAILILFFREDPGKNKETFRKLVIAGILTLFLAAPFLLSFLRFVPDFVKDVDPNFQIAQPLEYAVLNLVIREQAYYWSPILDKAPFPHLYTLYIGWVPVILAILALFQIKHEDRRIVYYMGVAALLVFLVASGTLLKVGAVLLPVIAGFRHSPQIAGMAVPLILGLAAYGLDQILSLQWPSLRMNYPDNETRNTRGFSLKWLVIIALIVNLNHAFQFSKNWYYSRQVHENVYELLDGLVTEERQWVAPPFGEHDYVETAIAKGLNISPGILPWYFKDREPPQATLVAIREGAPTIPAKRIDVIDEIKIYRIPGEFYASIEGEEKLTPCLASGTGGLITVQCDHSIAGRLIVKENAFSGWRAWEDGKPITLIGAKWLEVETSAGTHVYQFKYIAWDVFIGIVFALIAIFAGALYVSREDRGSIL